MIQTIFDVKCNAAHPELALPAYQCYKDSFATFKICDVPKKVGLWEITGLIVAVAFPDGSNQNVEAVRVNNMYVATIPPTSTAGTSTFGYSILAKGKDENGDDTDPWILGKGDVVILENDGSITPSPSVHYMTFDTASVAPSNPHIGQTYRWINATASGIAMWDGEAWVTIWDSAGTMAKIEAASANTYLSAQNYVNEHAQAKLSDPQLAAIQEVEDKRATIFDKGESGESRIYATELGRNNIPAGVGSVEVGSTVGNIGNYAFSENYDLYWVDFSKAESLDTIGEFAFQNTYLNQNIVLPKKLTTIGQKAFSGGAYTFFTIPASVVNIGYLAFEDVNCPIVFEGKSLAQVQSMTNYPWGHLDTTKITVTNVATEEWVEGKGYLTAVPDTYKTYADTKSTLSSDGYATLENLRYAQTFIPAFSGSAQLSDLAINRVVVPFNVTSLSVEFPPQVSLKARDFMMYFTLGQQQQFEIVLPQNYTFQNAAGTVPEIALSGTTLLYFTEVEAGTFLLKGETMKTITVS